MTAGTPKSLYAGAHTASSDTVGASRLTRLSDDDWGDDTDNESVVEERWDSMELDLWSAFIVVLIKDSYYLRRGTEHFCSRVSRLALTTGLTIFMVALQLFLVIETRRLITARSVYQVRQHYDDYVDKVYINGTLVEENFKQFDQDKKHTICSFPLSQPGFMFAVLLIWALSVCNNLRKCVELSYRLLWVTPRITCVSDMLQASSRHREIRHLAGLTVSLKVAIILVVVVPRLFTNAILLYLGSRWLVSTLDFGEVLMDAVTLEFILLLKDVLFHTVLSRRMQLETERLKVLPLTRSWRVGMWPYFNTCVFLIFSVVFAYAYMYHFQDVLPKYKWDLQEICAPFLRQTSVLT